MTHHGAPRRRWPLWLAGTVTGVLAAIALALALTISPEDSGPYPEELRWQELSTGGVVPRQWSVGVPPAPGDKPSPAVVSLHPLGGNRSGWAGETDLAAAAAANGFILVVPQGLWGTWNAGECCAPSSSFAVDDVGFLDEVLEQTAARDDVDADRVYLAGLSNGALMVTEYLCNGSFQPTAAAAVAVIPWSVQDCTGEVPLLVSVGTQDEVFPFDGGRTVLGSIVSGRASRSWADASDSLVRAWGCTGDPAVTEFSLWSRPQEPTTRWERSEYTDCTAPLTLTTVEGVPHTWLWGGDWSHTREVIDFFGLAVA